jgi:hypothetical protein
VKSFPKQLISVIADVALDIDFNSICDNPLYDTILNDEITEEELRDAI